MQYILAELCLGGMVAETNMVDILTHYTDQEKFEKQEVGGAKRSFATWPGVARLPAFVVDLCSVAQLLVFNVVDKWVVVAIAVVRGGCLELLSLLRRCSCCCQLLH